MQKSLLQPDSQTDIAKQENQSPPLSANKNKRVLWHQQDWSIAATIEATSISETESLYCAKHDILSAFEVSQLDTMDDIHEEVENFNQLMFEVALPAYLWMNEKTKALELRWQETRLTADAVTFAKSLFSEASLLAHSLRYRTFSKFNLGRQVVTH